MSKNQQAEVDGQETPITNMVRVNKMIMLARRVFVCLMVLLTVSTLLFASSLRIARAASTMTVGVYSETYLSANVTDSTLGPGSSLTMDVQVTNVPPIVNSTNGGINGFNLLVNYNPSILNATNADFKSPLCPSSAGCLFDTSSAFGLPSHINSPPGNTTVSAVLLAGAVSAPVGTLFRIQFKVKGIGYTDITVFPATRSEGIGITGPVHGATEFIPYDPASGSFDNRRPFSLSATPATGIITVPGESVSTNITVSRGISPSADVFLSISGALPEGMSYSFSSARGTYPFSSILTLTTTTTTPPGKYQVTVNGTCVSCSPSGTSFSQVLVFPITVKVPPPERPMVSVFSNVYSSSNVTDSSLTPGHTVIFEVNVANAPTFNGYEFSLFFDPHFLQFSSSDTITRTVFANPLTVREDASIPGTYKLVVVNLRSDNTAATGTLAHLKFNIVGVGVSPLSLAAGMANPSTFATEGDWTRLVLGSTPLDTATADGYFKNDPVHLGPVASFTFSPSSPRGGEAVVFDASMSFDPDTTHGFLNYTWDFGALGSSGGLTTQTPLVTHSFGTPSMLLVGNFSVRLTVTDRDDHFQGMQVKRVFVAPPAIDIPPVADFAFSPSNPTVGQSVVFDGSLTRDPDGSIVSYSWNFGDGSQTVGGNPVSRRFSTPGSYPVTLTVTDNAGLKGNKTELVLVVRSPDTPPVARFTFSPTTPTVGSTVAFDGSHSFDPDGSVQSWSWNFGDNSLLGSGPDIFHSYSSAGNYTVTLTVMDNAGLTGSVSMIIPVHVPVAHDVGVVFVNVEQRTAVSGQVVTIVVGLSNNGQSSEVVNVTAYYDSHVAASLNGITLTPNNPMAQPPFPNVVLDLSWDTTGVAPGNYTISATVFLATDQNPANNHLNDGNVTILPPPTLALTPNSGALGTQVVVHGSGFPTPEYGPSELFISFDDQFLGFAFPHSGVFNFTFNVLHADPTKPHHVKAFDVFSGLTIVAGFHVLPEPLPLGGLAVTVDVGTVYFPSDSAVIYLLTSLNGSPVSSGVQLQIQLVRPDGSRIALHAASVSTGLFKALYTIPKTGSTGTYAIVAIASQNGANAVALGSFEVKPSWLASQSGRTTTMGLALVGIVGLFALAAWKGYGGKRREDS